MIQKIVLGSVLKPVNDARMYEKIATSISGWKGMDIFICGSEAEVPGAPSNISFFPIFKGSRLHWTRFLAPWKFYKILLKVKPQYIIITTHELLIVTCVYRILFGSRIIYDVQENYYRNIAFTGTFPPVIRILLGGWVRLKEYITRPFVTHYLLAEKNYEKEFTFTTGKSTVLENKARRPLIPVQRRSHPLKSVKFLYSGTISIEYGIFDAIDLVSGLHRIFPEVSLTIIGYCANNQTFKLLKEKLQVLPFVHLTGGDQLVPHQKIIREIIKHDFGLISYRPNKSTINCIPTKLYEYLAYRLPVISSPNPVWEELIRKYQAGVIFDYREKELSDLWMKIQKDPFYHMVNDQGIYWEEESEKLKSLFQALQKD